MIFTEDKKGPVLFASFVIPVVLMLVIFWLLGIWPFGDLALLSLDMNGQYISFFSYYRSLLIEGGSLFYTFSKPLGGDMIGLWAYYLSSPLNLIFLFFKTPSFPMGILLLTLLKIGLSGLTMNIFLNRIETDRSSLVFSTSYALMAYNIVYHDNIMWLDGIILLPIIILGIEKTVRDKSILCYIVSLSAAITINYYIGFMLCIFSALYFICYLVFIQNDFQVSKLKSYQPVLWFGLSSLLAGGLSAFIVLPTIYSLQGGKFDFSLSELDIASNFPLFDLFAKYIIGSSDMSQQYAGLPNIYCGVFALVFGILYFTSSKQRYREKIGFGLLLLAMIGSFQINLINIIWHGFNMPVGFPYRYSFIFSFSLILVAYKGYRESSEHLPVKRFHMIILTVLVAAMLIDKFEYPYLDFRKIYGTVILTALALIALVIYSKYKNRLFYFTIVFICFLDLGINAYLSLSWRVELNLYNAYERFTEYVEVSEKIINQVKQKDDSFYRMDRTYRSVNDPMMFNFRGLSHFSSSAKASTQEFLAKMGFEANATLASYNDGSSISVDSLLGVKYLLTMTGTTPPSELLTHSSKPYEFLWQEGQLSVFRNPYALPLGFMVSDNVLHVSMDEDNFFNLQNNIWEAMTGKTTGRIFVQDSLGYYQDEAVFIDYYHDLAASPFVVNHFTNSYFEGEITNQNGKDLLLFSIPYEEDWQIYINGRRATALNVFGALLAVYVPEGTHGITLKYVPSGLYMGITISVLSFVLVAAYAVINERRKRVQKAFSDIN